jgi:hypothetical protein
MTYDHLELSSALADVRRAYRLLWGFQRRMDDLANAFSQHLEFQNYYEKEKVGLWARLQMISYGYFFVRKTHRLEDYPSGDYVNFPQRNDMMLYIWLESDTEFTRAYERTKKEPIPTEFNDVNQSKSQLHAHLYLNKRDRREKTNWFDTSARTSNRIEYDRLTDHKSVEDMQCYGCRWDLTDLGDEDAVLAAADTLKSGFVTASSDPWPMTSE